MVRAMMRTDVPMPDTAPNLRQKDVIEKALSFVNQALEGTRQGMSAEILAIDIRQALDCLGEITGETTTEDILDEIFSRFCLGK